MSENLVYPELSYKILGCCFAVYNELGPFYKEDVYQRALEIDLARKGIPFESQKSVDLHYLGELVGRYQLDLVIEGCNVLELKSADTLHPQHTSQLIQYLELTGCQLGILINFGSPNNLTYRRIAHQPKRLIRGDSRDSRAGFV